MGEERGREREEYREREKERDLSTAACVIRGGKSEQLESRQGWDVVDLGQMFVESG